MKEIEAKILDVKPSKIAADLKAIGARKKYAKNIHALYFDVPTGRLGKKKETLRLRKVGTEVEFAYKKKLPGNKVRIMEELETKVAGFKETKKILLALGYRVIREIKKKRTHFVKGKTCFELDVFPGIPPLLEIESPSVSELKHYVKRLGFTMQDTNTWTTFEVLKHYGKN